MWKPISWTDSLCLYSQRKTQPTFRIKVPSPYASMEGITVTPNGVEKLLNNLQPDKATGPDMIPARLLKQLSAEIAPALALVFQSSLNFGRVPRDWTMIHVIPLFKKVDKSTASNYRPVSLTSICSKVREHILHSNIMDHLDSTTSWQTLNTDSVVRGPARRNS